MTEFPTHLLSADIFPHTVTAMKTIVVSSFGFSMFCFRRHVLRSRGISTNKRK